MSLRASDRAACEELASAPGSEFHTLRGFMPEPSLARQLALEALFRSLRDIPMSVSDPAVGIAKIGWWQRELAAAEQEGSQHPVVRALADTGCLSLVQSEAFTAYLHALVTNLQEDSVPDTKTLHDRLADTAGNEARLLAAGARIDEAAIVNAACAARLLELARTLARPGGEFDWLPLDLVARHGFRAAEGPASPARGQMVAALAELATAWRRAAPITIPGCNTEGAAFLAVRDRLVGRRLARAARSPRSLLERGQRGSVGDVIAAWQAARKLRPVLEGQGGG